MPAATQQHEQHATSTGLPTGDSWRCGTSERVWLARHVKLTACALQNRYEPRYPVEYNINSIMEHTVSFGGFWLCSVLHPHCSDSSAPSLQFQRVGKLSHCEPSHSLALAQSSPSLEVAVAPSYTRLSVSTTAYSSSRSWRQCASDSTCTDSTQVSLHGVTAQHTGDTDSTPVCRWRRRCWSSSACSWSASCNRTCSARTQRLGNSEFRIMVNLNRIRGEL